MNIRRMPILGHVKCDVNPLRRSDPRVNLVLHPVFGNFLLDDANIPTKSRAKVTAAAGDSETALGAASAESSIGSTDRTALAECDLVFLWFRSWRWLRLGFRDLLFLGLDLRVLALNVDGLRLFLFNLGLGLSNAFGFI